ncbi:MAG: response regulator, partial [Planctomycetota bacterium]
MRVLFVDDDELNQKTGQAILQRITEDFVIVGSAKEAIAKAQEFEPDVILMDIAMPNIDGIEATRLIRQLNLSRSPYILGISGFIA